MEMEILEREKYLIGHRLLMCQGQKKILEKEERMVDGGAIIIPCGCWKFVDPHKRQEVQCSVNALLAS